MRTPTWLIAAKDLLTSPLNIGALEISPTAIKYLAIRGNAILQASLRLPPGIIEKGAIKDRGLFLAALKNVHAQITPVAARPVSVILIAPSNVVFTQAFSVPLVANTNLNETISLNLQTISPTKIEESYYDYQEIKLHKELGTLELLGAFAKRETIAGYEEAIREAGFTPIAVEFPGLSLARLIRDRWGGIELEQDYLMIYLSGEGMLTSILKNGSLGFNHFTPWQELGGGVAQPNDFNQIKEAIKREIQRVTNFHVGKTGRQLQEAILISPVFNYEIVSMTTEELKMKIRNLSIPELPKLPPGWFPALGGALRGLTSRSKDAGISLALENSQVEYFHERTLNFIELWRNILIGSCAIVIAALVLLDTVMVRTERQLVSRSNATKNSEYTTASVEIQKKINAFNTALDRVEKLQKNEIAWSNLLTTVAQRAGSKILLTRIDLRRSGTPSTINGRGAGDAEILAFKEALKKIPGIKDVDLPLSNIAVESDKSATFSLALTLQQSDGKPPVR